MTRKIVQLILEARGNQGLSIFDIDETLFYSKAKVKVVKDGKVIKSLDNVQFNNYKLGNGEDFDFGEFKSAKIFNQTSTPIGRMIAKAKAIITFSVSGTTTLRMSKERAPVQIVGISPNINTSRKMHL